MIGNSIQKTSEPEAEVSSGNLPVTANVKASENLSILLIMMMFLRYGFMIILE